MPDYNLGTAHGRIKIDVDDRGAKQAETSVNSLERTMQSLDKRLGAVQSSLNKLHSEMGRLTTELSKANKESERFDESVGMLDDNFLSASKHTREWSRDIGVLTHQIRQAINAAEQFGPKIFMLGNFAKSFRNGNGGIGGFLGALSKSGMAAAGVGLLSRQLFGINEAMKNVSGWQAKFLQFGSAIQRVLAIGGILNWATRGRIGILSLGKAVDLLSGGIAKLSNKMLGLQILPQISIKMGQLAASMKTVFNGATQTSAGLKTMLNGLFNVAVGTTVLKHGVKGIVDAYKRLGWAGKIAVAGLVALGSIGPAALELVSKGLVKISNLLAGLLDGVKQLSGAFLALPGAISMVGVAASTLFGIFKGLSKSFKDIFDIDPAKSSEALAAMPMHLRGLGKALADVAPKFRELQKIVQSNFFYGADKQIKILSDQLLPKLQTGMVRVSNAMRTAKDRFVEFAVQADTQRDLSRIYGTTAQTINTLSYALKPVLAGFRDISIVGARFLSELSAGVPALAQKFAAWADINRRNGNMMRWMQESWTGAKNLTKGIVDATKAVWTLLTLFSTNNGDNFLERFANSMKKFNETVQKSAAGGVLRDIGNAVRTMGTEHLDNLKRVLGAVWDTMKAGWPIVEKFVHQMGTIMSKALDHVLSVFQTFLSFFNKQQDFTLLDSIGEVFAGLGKAIYGAFAKVREFMGAIKEFFGPVADIVEVIARWATGFQGLVEVLGVLKPVFKFIGEIFKELLSTSVPVVGAIVGVAVAFSLMHKALAPIKGVAKFLIGFFTTARGLGATLMGAAQSLKMFGSAGTFVSGIAQKLVSGFVALNVAVLAAAAAWMIYRQGQQQIENSNKAIADSASHTKVFVEDLKQAFIDDKGIAGRNVFTAVENSSQQMLDKLQAASDSAIGSLGAITDYLEGGNNTTLLEKWLGIDQNNWLRGITQAIPAIGSYLNQASGNSDMVNRLQEDAEAAKQTKQEFDSLGIGAKQLQDIITGSEESFKQHKAVVEADGDAGAKAAEKMQQMRDAYLETEAAAKKLGPAGMTLVQGLQELAGAALDADQKLQGLRHVLEGLGIIKVDPLQAAFDWAEGLRNIDETTATIIANGGQISDIIDKTTNSFNTNNEAAKQLFDQLKPLGDQFLTQLSQNGADPTKIYKEFQDKFQAQIDALNAASQAAGQGIAINQEQAQNLANAVGILKPDELVKKLDAVLNSPNKELMLQFNLSEEDIRKAKETISKIVNPTADPNKPPTTEINKDKNGVPIPVVIDPKSADQIQSAVEEIINNAKITADEKSKALENSGFLFGEAFAKGIERSKDSVNVAAEALVIAALENYHQSPPKKGPLAKRGDAIKYAGGVFARQYARGIGDNADAATGAAVSMAQGVVSGASQVGAGVNSAGKFLGQLFDLTDIASRITNVFSQVSETIFGFAKFISDPMGKGTFFGKNLGYKKTVSDAELQKKQQDKLFSDYLSTNDSASRDTRNFDPATGMMKPAFVPGALSSNASKSEIQASIIAEGQRRGLNSQQIQAALAVAQIESGYVPNIDGGIQPAPGQAGTEADRALGIYQQKASWGTAAQRTDPNYAIKAFLDAYQKQLATGQDPLLAATLTQNPQLGANATGSKYYNTVGGALAQSTKDYNDIIKNPPKISPSDMGLQLAPQAPIKGGDSVTYTPQWMMEHGFAPLYSRDAKGNAEVPQWAQQLAASFNLTASTYNDPGGGLHGGGMGGWAFDFGGNAADMERFAQFLQQNMAGSLAQLIFQSPTKDYGIAGGTDVGGMRGQGRYYGSDGYAGHGDHVHGAFFRPPGVYPATADMPGSKMPSFLQPYSGGDTNKIVLQQNPQTGAWEQTTPHGQNAGVAPGDINPGTQKPYTPEERKALEDAMPLQFTLPDGMTMEDFQTAQQTFGNINSTQALTASMMQENAILQGKAIQDNPTGYTESQISSVLVGLDDYIGNQKNLDTAVSRAQAAQAENIKSSIMSSAGMTQQENPIDTVANIASQSFSVASDVIGTIVSGIEAIGAGEDIARTMVRGVEGTKQVGRLVDDVQKFIDFGGKIAGTVASVSGLAASFAGAGASGDPSGGASGAAAALGAVSTIAGLVQAGFDTANAVIDLTQETVRIAGGYVGEFLGYLVGGPGGGPLNGNIKFLLDKQTNQLLTYSSENPLDKRTFDLPFTTNSTNSRQQGIGTINVYGGPGSDPRDLTRQMMWQVNSAQYAGALGQ